MRPILEYCSPVWTPHHRYLIDKVEHVLRYFTKRIRGMWNIPYDQRLDLLNLKSLEYRRVVNDLTMCYRILIKDYICYHSQMTLVNFYSLIE